MEGKTQRGCSLCKVFGFVVGLFLVVAISSTATLLIATNFYADSLCGSVDARSRNLQFSSKTEWDATDRLDVEAKGVTVVRTSTNNRCYIMPLSGVQGEDKMARPLMLINDPLSEQVLEQLAGSDAVEFCIGQETYLLKEVKEGEDPTSSRRRRQAPAAAIPPIVAVGGGPEGAGPAEPAVHAPRASAAEGAPVGAPGHRDSGLDLPLEQREPRCIDMVLDCSKDGAVGQVVYCYTWVNGAIKMAQRCDAPNKFQIYMTKPPGRILKIAQQQWVICLQRRQQGLRC